MGGDERWRRLSLDELWQEVLTQQFHDILPGSSIAWVHADAEATHARVEQQLRRRIADILATLAPATPTLTNVASHDRDEIVIVDDSTSSIVEGVAGAPSGSGPTQSLAGGGLAFRARVPGNGLAPAVARAVDDHVVVTDRSMTNHHLAVRWDDAGNLTSIIDVEHAREIVPERAVGAVLELAPDHPVEYDAWDLEVWTPANAKPLTTADQITVVDDGPLVGTVARRSILRRFDGLSHVLAARRQPTPRHPHRDRLARATSTCFRWCSRSTCTPTPRRATCSSGSVRRPTHPTTSWDAAKFEVCAHRYVDIAEPGFGVAILNDGRYGHGVFDGQVRVSLLRAARYPDPDADQGSHASTWRSYPHGTGLADVVAEAERVQRAGPRGERHRPPRSPRRSCR